MNAPPSFEERINEIRKLVRELDTECAEMRQDEALQGPAASFFTPAQFELMSRVASKALLLAVLMIHRSGQGHIVFYCGDILYRHLCRRYQTGVCPRANDCNYIRDCSPFGNFQHLSQDDKAWHGGCGECYYTH